MKEGSIALVGQISTISKIRIYNPAKQNDSLKGIKLRPEQLDLLDAKIIELYTHKWEDFLHILVDNLSRLY